MNFNRPAIVVQLAQDKVSGHVALAFHFNLAMLLNAVSIRWQTLLGRLAHVDLHRLTARLHSIRHVYRVAKQAISWPSIENNRECSKTKL
jgi:hypothetical protein